MDLTLTPLFLNIDIAAPLLGVPAREIEDVLAQPRGLISLYRRLGEDLAAYTSRHEIPELQVLQMKDQIEPGQLVSLQQAFYFKRELTAQGEMIRFHGKLNTDGETRIEGSIDPARFAHASTHGILSGRANIDVIGRVIDSGAAVRLQPVFLGWRGFGLTDSERRLGLVHNDRRVYPSNVDNFDSIDWETPLTADQIAATTITEEAVVKSAIAELLHEFNVEKDWGGELSDLYTLNLRLDGQQISSAWLLKGKSVRRQMKIADLGKNGDQIVRLASEPAHLLVMQSNCGQTAAVQHMLGAFAHDMRYPRRYMVLDGDATGKILRDSGHEVSPEGWRSTS